MCLISVSRFNAHTSRIRDIERERESKKLKQLPPPKVQFQKVGDEALVIRTYVIETDKIMIKR